MAGRLPWVNLTPVTQVASPLVSPWLQVPEDMGSVLPVFLFTTGTSTNTLEGSFDGVALDSTLPAYAAMTTGTALVVRHPYIRWRTVQTVADATVSTVYLRKA
jgi:hypothetical protein